METSSDDSRMPEGWKKAKGYAACDPMAHGKAELNFVLDFMKEMAEALEQLQSPFHVGHICTGVSSTILDECDRHRVNCVLKKFKEWK